VKDREHIEALLDYAEEFLKIANIKSEIDYLHGCISTLKWVLED